MAWTAAIWCLLVAAASFLAAINVWSLTIDFYYLDNDGVTPFGCNANEIFGIWHDTIPWSLWWIYAVSMLSIATYIPLKRSRLGLVDLLGMTYALVSLVFIGMPRFMAIVREEWTRIKAK